MGTMPKVVLRQQSWGLPTRRPWQQKKGRTQVYGYGTVFKVDGVRQTAAGRTASGFEASRSIL